MGVERKIVQKKMLFLLGKRHDNIILNLKLLLSRNFVVVAQAPIMGVEWKREGGVMRHKGHLTYPKRGFGSPSVWYVLYLCCRSVYHAEIKRLTRSSRSSCGGNP